ncbi:11849_t:CDS:2 [Funneliformis geosporum]|uniref:14714_t:CDS:1 n=1 Tax=Funneliformis geosporum TaxID=1117311 RepID=A0A9W4SI24_9GLOM|nr:14714_t:CDS:2 [Funneliformis geosporum]CAI2170017.1 11849_t:CDS:2 [Funneliformis geosporum]
MPNTPNFYTNYIQKSQPPFTLYCSIRGAKQAECVDKLEEYYTKCKVINIFQSKGNYLKLNDVTTVYFHAYFRALVYNGILKNALDREMGDVLHLIEMNSRVIIVRLREPYQLVKNDILSSRIISITFEYEKGSIDLEPDQSTMERSTLKVKGWLKKQMGYCYNDNEEISDDATEVDIQDSNDDEEYMMIIESDGERKVELTFL